MRGGRGVLQQEEDGRISKCIINQSLLLPSPTTTTTQLFFFFFFLFRTGSY